jgi:hypothetical protein
MRRFLVLFLILTGAGLANANPKKGGRGYVNGLRAVKYNFKVVKDDPSFKMETPQLRPGDWNQKAREWTARSVIGEASFSSYGEATSIAWVYAKLLREQREKGKKLSYVIIVKEYSAAVKARSTHQRPWILELFIGMKAAPAGWPAKLSWKRHLKFWNRMLTVLDDWARGNRPDPTPMANEYGGVFDDPNALKGGWEKVPTPPKFMNHFWHRKVEPKPPEAISNDDTREKDRKNRGGTARAMGSSVL